MDRPPFIVPFTGEKEKDAPGWKEGIFEALIGVGRPLGGDNGKKKKEEQKRTKGKAFNILDVEPDVQKCNGQSIAIMDKEFHALKGSDVGVFMVNLTKVINSLKHLGDFDPIETRNFFSVGFDDGTSLESPCN